MKRNTKDTVSKVRYEYCLDCLALAETLPEDPSPKIKALIEEWERDVALYRENHKRANKPQISHTL